MATPIPRQFRLHDETIETIDRLAVRLGLSARADVLRVAIKRLADQELTPTGPATGKPKKKSGKHSG